MLFFILTFAPSNDTKVGLAVLFDMLGLREAQTGVRAENFGKRFYNMIDESK